MNEQILASTSRYPIERYLPFIFFLIYFMMK